MIKTTAINPTLTPEGKIPFAASVIGRESPASQWKTSGQIVASVHSNSPLPTLCFVTSAGVQVSHDVAGDSFPAFMDYVRYFTSEVYEFDPGTDTGARREITVSGFSSSLAVLMGSDPCPELELPYSILKPRMPRYSMGSLVDALQSELDFRGIPYVIAVDRRSGHVAAAMFSPRHSDLVESSIAAAAATHVCGFVQSVEGAASTPRGLGWIPGGNDREAAYWRPHSITIRSGNMNGGQLTERNTLEVYGELFDSRGRTLPMVRNGYDGLAYWGDIDENGEVIPKFYTFENIRIWDVVAETDYAIHAVRSQYLFLEVECEALNSGTNAIVFRTSQSQPTIHQGNGVGCARTIIKFDF